MNKVVIVTSKNYDAVMNYLSALLIGGVDVVCCDEIKEPDDVFLYKTRQELIINKPIIEKNEKPYFRKFEKKKRG